MRYYRLPLAVLAIVLPAVLSPGDDGVAVPDAKSDSNSIVQAALQAEMDGDAPRRGALLARALQRDPDHLTARWHSGHVRTGDRWLTVEQAEQSTAEKGAVAAYRHLRDRHGANLAGEMSLARWCRKNGLEDQERLHWSNVLRFDRGNKEARSRLRVREFRGRLMTGEQIDNWKRAKQQYKHALDIWNPRLRRWRLEIESSPSPEQTEAWQQLKSVADAQAVPSLEQMYRKAGAELRLQIVATLGNMEEQVSTDALVRLAVDALDAEIRQTAAAELSNRSWFAFVPNLLGRLETPVECRYFVNTLGSRIFSQVLYSQEQPSAVVNLSRTVDSEFRLAIARTSTPLGVQRALARRQAQANAEASRQYRGLLEAQQAVWIKNMKTAMLNERVYAALQTTTGQQLVARPQSWWQWWQEHNELQTSDRKPEIQFSRSQRFSRVIRVCSCFLAGTPVWTDSGPVSIEKVRPGDRVLSQDPDSGELAYQMVLETTNRPPSPTLRIQIADDHIIATLGHPLWGVGSGWRMAKELKAGDHLHTVRGGIVVDEIRPGPTFEAHNLVVAATNTYFVGKHGLLVHDNTPRRPTDLPVPGWGWRAAR